MTRAIFENAMLNWQEMKIPLQLEKAICIGWYQEGQHRAGHFSDYLSGIQSCVALRARKDSQLVVWDSGALLSHCSYNDPLNVSFHVTDADMQEAGVLNVESWSGNNGFILRRTKERCDVTYYFALLHVHALTGELSVSPCFYFIENPDFILSADTQSSIQELLKAEPIQLSIKADQIVCFDKFHYQMEYNGDFSFVRVQNAR